MKKFTDFIVEKRYYILIIFILLTGLCLYLSNYVTVNHNIADYLPTDSVTRKGMDIMEDTFDPLKSSDLNIMFDDLKEQDKLDIKDKLSKIKNVASVSYEEGRDYNYKNHTLYVVNVKDTADSKMAREVYKEIKREFKDYKYFTSGNIASNNEDVLHLWIIILAIVCAMIILIIMCSSYIEPFLFLFTIGLAVFMNKGTNIMFSSVSFITNSIVAILQLALSMDYSIMLMNRYTQEREVENNKEVAMKKALKGAFSSISSSSVTTIVGLLALVFMSFTIGRDLGFVLAKGVLFSLISIFFCLPGLILLFDKLIVKTKKKSLNINLNFLGKTVFKMRYVALILFILLFGLSFFLKDGLNILYTGSQNDIVRKYFNENNTVAIVYNNKYEREVSKYCNNLNDKSVTKVLCYGNTINQPLKSNEVNQKLEELGIDTTIDQELLNILYYNYYVKTNNKLSSDEVVKFIKNNVYNNKTFNNKIDNNLKDNINLLENFTNKKLINKKRTSKDIAKLLNVKQSDIDALYVLYNASKESSKLSTTNFIEFLNKDILTNQTYSSMIDKKDIDNIKRLSTFTNKSIILEDQDVKNLANLFDLEEETTKNILILYYQNHEAPLEMNSKEVIDGIIYLKNNTHYIDNVDVTSLLSLKPFIDNENNINETKLSKAYLKNIFDKLAPNYVDTIYLLGNIDENTMFTPNEFINLTITNYSSYLPETLINSLNIIKFTMESANIKLKASELSQMLSIDNKTIYSLYTLIGTINNYEFKISPYNFVNTILDSKKINSSLDESTLKKLNILSKVMSKTINNDLLNSNEMSSLLGINLNNMHLLYSLYETNNKEIKISLLDFTDFLLKELINKNYLDNQTIETLKTVNTLMHDTLNDIKYDENTLYNHLIKISPNIESNMIDAIYVYYGSINNYNDTWTLTIEELVNYLNKDILKDKRFNSMIPSELKNDIKSSKTKVNEARDLLVGTNYSRAILNTKYDLESKETFAFIENIQSVLNKDDIYVIGDSPMALDMSKSFGKELDFITILTMLAIFVVVAITFKSLIIPLILVLIIQCAVYITMSSLSIAGSSVYFIALLIVQSILMGATIDYAIVYTSYYKESRNKGLGIKEAVINSYNNSIHTILTSSSILVIVTLIVGNFASEIAAQICMTLSKGTFCSALLILLILPPLLAIFDKYICKDLYNKKIKR